MSATCYSHVRYKSVTFRPHVSHISAICRPYLIHFSSKFQPNVNILNNMSANFSHKPPTFQPYISHILSHGSQMLATCQPPVSCMPATGKLHASHKHLKCQTNVNHMSAERW